MLCLKCVVCLPICCELSPALPSETRRGPLSPPWCAAFAAFYVLLMTLTRADVRISSNGSAKEHAS